MLRNRSTGPLLGLALVATMMLAVGPGDALAGAACVMAKHQGQTLDFAIAVGMGDPAGALEAAETELREKGFGDYRGHLDIVRAQNLTELDHGYAVVIRSEFDDWRGRPRSAMGCGFSGQSYRDAEWDAVRDLQRYFWGWKPDQYGYEVVRQLTF